MIDIQLIREQTEAVKRNTANKNKNPELVDDAKRLDQQKRQMQLQVEAFQSNLNTVSKEIAGEFGQKKLDLLRQGGEISAEIDKHKPELEALEKEFAEVMAQIPNMSSEDTPVGKDESENKVLKTVGEKPKFDFTPKEHWQLGEELGLIDIETASKVSGSRFAYLKGKLALLEFALIQYVMQTLTDQRVIAKIVKEAGLNVSDKSFEAIVPPVFIRPEVMQRMARLEPKEERYHIESDDLYLIGSAEHTLGPIHMDEVLKEEDLPVRYLGFSTSFRREAGSYGKDTKGILRLHQFDKVEMESFSSAKTGMEEHLFFIAVQEYLMQALGIAYQTVISCTGDLGDPNARKVDIEAWMPGQDKYRETHSADYMTDYQARRLRTRSKASNGTTELVHMNDATAFAIGRTLIAIMENYQQKDGSITVPAVLMPYTQFDHV